MKRISILLLALAMVLSVSVYAVQAESGFASLIPDKDAKWADIPCYDTYVTADYKEDGTVVFAGSVSGTWPAIEHWYATPVVADLENDEFVLDITVEGGNTNINFFFDDGNGGSVGYTICNSMFADRTYDAGSGDLGPDTYTVTVPVKEFTETTKLYDGSAFPASAIKDGKITFLGLQVYSTNGASITVRSLGVQSAKEDTPPVEDEPSEPADPTEVNEILISHVNLYCWNAYNCQIITGEGNNCNNYAHTAFDGAGWIAIRVENIDGTYTVTDIEGADDTKVLTAPADGFMLYCGFNDTVSFAASQKISVGDVLVDKTCEWTTDVASATTIGSLFFAAPGTDNTPSEDESSESAPSVEESSKPSVPSGDAGILTFAVLAVVSLAGVAVVVKSRKGI